MLRRALIPLLATALWPTGAALACDTDTLCGDGGPATAAGLLRPGGLAVDPRLGIFVADTANDAIRRVTPDGVIPTVAGLGAAGFGGDGGPAIAAQLNAPADVAVGSDGSYVIADA